MHYTIKEQDICLEAEQSLCQFELHPNERPGTVIVYIGKGYICMRTLCDFILVDNIAADTSNHSNTCVCTFTEVV